MTNLSVYVRLHNLNFNDMLMSFMDVKNAFGMMKIDPKDVCLIPVLILENPNIILVRTMCFFGKSEYPYAYNVISSCINKEIKLIVHGTSDTYVDDTRIFSEKIFAIEDQEAGKSTITEGFGDKGICDDKSSSNNLNGYNFKRSI